MGDAVVLAGLVGTGDPPGLEEEGHLAVELLVAQNLQHLCAGLGRNQRAGVHALQQQADLPGADVVAQPRFHARFVEELAPKPGHLQALGLQGGIDAIDSQNVDEDVGSGVVAEHDHQLHKVAHGDLQAVVHAVQRAAGGHLVLRFDPIGLLGIELPRLKLAEGLHHDRDFDDAGGDHRHHFVVHLGTAAVQRAIIERHMAGGLANFLHQVVHWFHLCPYPILS